MLLRATREEGSSRWRDRGSLGSGDTPTGTRGCARGRSHDQRGTAAGRRLQRVARAATRRRHRAVRVLIASDYYPPFIGGAHRQTRLLAL